MSKTPLYLVILLALLLLAYFFVIKKPTATINQVETAFAVADTASINKIELLSNKGYRIVLTRQSDYQWLVNDRYFARPDAVQTLLSTIKRLKVKNPVSKAAYPTVMKSFEKPLKTVKIYNDINSKPIKSYTIGGTTSGNRGTYMLLDGFDMPYVMYLPGLDGHLTTRYFTRPEEWRDRMLYNYPKSNIKSVSLTYHNKPSASFVLEALSDTTYTVTSPNKVTVSSNQKINRPFIHQYLNSFQNLYAESFENGHPNIDSLQASKPFCTLQVRTKNGKSKTLVLHYKPITQRSKLQFDEQGKAIPHDLDRYFAFINKGNDLILIQDYVFGKILKQFPDFWYDALKE